MLTEVSAEVGGFYTLSVWPGTWRSACSKQLHLPPGMVLAVAKRMAEARSLGALGREVVSAVRYWRKEVHAVDSWLPAQRKHIGADGAPRRAGMGW